MVFQELKFKLLKFSLKHTADIINITLNLENELLNRY